MAEWVRVAAQADCPAGKLKGVTASGTHIVLANVDGTVCALKDECSHETYPLSDGELDGGDVVAVEERRLPADHLRHGLLTPGNVASERDHQG